MYTAGKDATGGFYGRNHSIWAQKKLKELQIGSLGDGNKKWFACPCACQASIAGLGSTIERGAFRRFVVAPIFGVNSGHPEASFIVAYAVLLRRHFVLKNDDRKLFVAKYFRNSFQRFG